MQDFSRRSALKQAACGFGGLALNGLISEEVSAKAIQPASLFSAGSGSVPVGTHPIAKAKRIIFVFMQGGPSQVDTFDPKPALEKFHNQKVEFYNPRSRKRIKENVFQSPWRFRQHGQSGRSVSELFPHMANCVDDFCLIRSMHTEGVAHGPSTLFLHTGATNLIRPSIGSWVTYGLGSENRDLPSFVTINAPPTKGGPRNYGNAFLPAKYQGVLIKKPKAGSDPGFKNLLNPKYTTQQQKRQFDYLQKLNQAQSGARQDDRLDAMIKSYELAFRMQQTAPAVIDIDRETAATKAMYGIGESTTDEFGRQCLLARRFAEEGVRYIQVSYSDTGSTPRWDQHSNLKKHEDHAQATDKPVAGLLQDLKQRGLLEDTIVWWGGEFGRTPFSQNNDGRDHNPNGFSIWLAGGGIKPGIAFGATDEFGMNAVENKVHMHDLHATLLHLLGLDHKQLTYRYAGRDFRLTDVYGRVVNEIIA